MPPGCGPRLATVAHIECARLTGFPGRGGTRGTASRMVVSLPADQFEGQKLADRLEVADVAGDQVGSHAPRRERDQYVEMDVTDLIDVKVVPLGKSSYDPARADPIGFFRGHRGEVPGQSLDEALRLARARAAGQLCHHDSADTDEEGQREQAILESGRAEVVYVHRRGDEGQLRRGGNHRAFRCR